MSFFGGAGCCCLHFLFKLAWRGKTTAESHSESENKVTDFLAPLQREQHKWSRGLALAAPSTLVSPQKAVKKYSKKNGILFFKYISYWHPTSLSWLQDKTIIQSISFKDHHIDTPRGSLQFVEFRSWQCVESIIWRKKIGAGNLAIIFTSSLSICRKKREIVKKLAIWQKIDLAGTVSKKNRTDDSLFFKKCTRTTNWRILLLIKKDS